MSQLSYAEIVAALAHVLNVKKGALPAFKARIRHLNNIGVAKLPKPGRGQKISYTSRHAFELLLALRLQGLHFPPKVAALMVAVASKSFNIYQESLEQFLVADDDGVVVKSGVDVGRLVENTSLGLFILNLSALADDLDRGLKFAATRT